MRSCSLSKGQLMASSGKGAISGQGVASSQGASLGASFS